MTQSSTPEGEPAASAIDEPATETVAEDVVAVPVPVAEDATAGGTMAVSETAPPSLFNPTMRDPDASTSETGMTVPPRPLEPSDEGDILPCTGPEADQALILGPPDGESGGAAIPVVQGEDGTIAPAVAPEAPSPVDTASLFRDWAVMWSGNPSEVGGDLGLAPSHGEVCPCDETSLAAGEGITGLAS